MCGDVSSPNAKSIDFSLPKHSLALAPSIVFYEFKEQVALPGNSALSLVISILSSKLKRSVASSLSFSTLPSSPSILQQCPSCWLPTQHSLLPSLFAPQGTTVLKVGAASQVT